MKGFKLDFFFLHNFNTDNNVAQLAKLVVNRMKEAYEQDFRMNFHTKAFVCKEKYKKL